MNTLAGLDISDNMVAIFTIMIAMMVPVVAILSKHQLKMTALMRDQQQAAPNEELTREIRDLKNIVAQQAYALDTISQSQKQLAARLESSGQLQDQLQIRG
jgi:hypothetical protein